jgi:hypothetical protein
VGCVRLKNKTSYSFEGLPLLRILRFAFLLLIAVIIVWAYYIQSKGELVDLIKTMAVEKGKPFVKAHWTELVGSLALFLLGFWCGRMSLEKPKRKNSKRSLLKKKDESF